MFGLVFLLFSTLSLRQFPRDWISLRLELVPNVSDSPNDLHARVLFEKQRTYFRG